MNFEEIISKLESIIGQQRKIELLERSFTAYAFGSGMIAYKVNGKVLKLIFDGRDGEITLLITPKHAKYPPKEFKTIFIGNAHTLFSDSSFLDQQIRE